MTQIDQETLQETIKYVYGLSDAKPAIQDSLFRKLAGQLLLSNIIILTDSCLLHTWSSHFVKAVDQQFKEFDGNVKVSQKDTVSLSSLPVNKVVEIIEEGLPISVFKELCSLLDLSEKKLAQTLRIPVSTLSKRKKRGYFSTSESERIVRLMDLLKIAIRVFDSSIEFAKKWFRNPAKALGGATPLEYIRTEQGAREVENLMGRIEHGVFT